MIINDAFKSSLKSNFFPSGRGGSVIAFILLTAVWNSFKYLPLVLFYCLSLTLIDKAFPLSLSASLSTFCVCSCVELKIARNN